MDDEKNRLQDTEHLKLLSTFHYVVGVFALMFGCFPVIHLVVGMTFLCGAAGGEGPFEVIGVVFVLVALLSIGFFWTLGLLLFLAAGRLRKRRGHTFCTVVAGLSCVLMPFGTILGVLTLIVLSRQSVKESFLTNDAS